MHCALFCFFFQLEKQLKELMEERDTVQSQLNCLLKGDGDDHGNERATKLWVFVLVYLTTFTLESLYFATSNKLTYPL